MKRFKHITDRIWNYGDERIVMFPTDTVRMVVAALENFMKDLTAVTAKKCAKNPFDKVVVNTVVQIIMRSVSDLEALQDELTNEEDCPDVNIIRELIYHGLLMIQLAIYTVVDKEPTFKETGKHVDIVACLTTILKTLSTLVAVHDQYEWVMDRLLYSEGV